MQTAMGNAQIRVTRQRPIDRAKGNPVPIPEPGSGTVQADAIVAPARTRISRCYKCQGYGHTAHYCREKTDICTYCARQGHRVGDCPNKEKRETCANCHHFGQEDDHSTNDRECPAYKFALEKEIRHTGYTKN
ncbi:hypothetical protein J437_LFUL016221 [Ladona fulva]|uniref:CCHC-type domain-containing protein n=1 Tax=Ladona fulva TaxID=123851 RepID=A0A8K0KPI3_LADFU|nr:hypothetical protein J437_LFUL016221 [Ladona fulva]